MKSDRWKKIRQLVEEALEAEPAERDAVLARASKADRPELERLLEAALADQTFLHTPVVKEADPEWEACGRTVGRYKLVKLLGEGGFGTVWLAEQEEPVQRYAALKLLKPGLDSRDVLRRFEAERQTLAVMNHPHIAQLYDGGITETGRSYFVMEWVDGVSITDFCNRDQLSLKRRLELFQQVCFAIHHAHQKGVIHRDIKPSNVLVTPLDGVATPKVIDFGIAKATGPGLTERTLHTAQNVMFGTPEYMAPEQTSSLSSDLDTRVDVYSLGVLLYEMLTSTRPFQLQSLLEQGYEEVLRVIREVDPPRPSVRARTSELDPAQTAKQRGLTAAAFRRSLQGDLDWIVMKALAKERERRYGSAAAFAEDIDRYLRQEPVLAGPPTTSYRVRKYIHRHKVMVTAGMVVFLALVVGLGTALVGLFEAKEQTAIAKTETTRALTVIELLEEMLSAAHPDEQKHPGYTVRELLDDFDGRFGDRLREEPKVDTTLRLIIGEAYLALGVLPIARRHLRRALDLARQLYGWTHPMTRKIRSQMALLVHFEGDVNEALEAYQGLANNLRNHSSKSVEDMTEFVLYLAEMAECLRVLGRAEQGLATAQEALRLVEQQDLDSVASSHVLVRLAAVFLKLDRFTEAEAAIRGAMERPMSVSMQGIAANQMAIILETRGKLGEAEEILRAVLDRRRDKYGTSDAYCFMTMNDLFWVLYNQKKIDEAETVAREALQIAQELPGINAPQIATQYLLLATCLAKQEECDSAVSMYHQAVSVCEEAGGIQDPSYAQALRRYGLNQAYTLCGDWQVAEKCQMEALRIATALHGEDDALVAQYSGDLALIRRSLGDFKSARYFAEKALATQRRLYSEENMEMAVVLKILADVYRDSGDIEEARTSYAHSLAIQTRLRNGEPGLLQSTVTEFSQVDVALGNLPRAAAVLVRHNRFAEARDLAQQTIDDLEQGASRRVVAKLVLGICRLAEDRLDEAEDLLFEVLMNLESVDREDQSTAQELIRTVIEAYRNRGEAGEAESWHEELLSLELDAPPPVVGVPDH